MWKKGGSPWNRICYPSNPIPCTPMYQALLVMMLPGYDSHSIPVGLGLVAYIQHFLKVHFVIHNLIPPFFSKKVEIFTLSVLGFVCRIFLANSFVWQNINTALCHKNTLALQNGPFNIKCCIL